MIDPNIWNHLMLTKDKKNRHDSGEAGFLFRNGPAIVFSGL